MKKEIFTLTLLVGMLFQSIAFDEFGLGTPLVDEEDLSQQVSKSELDVRLAKFFEDILIKNNDKIAILKNTKSDKFKNYFKKHFFFYLNGYINGFYKNGNSQEEKTYNIALNFPQHLQVKTRDSLIFAVILASRDWRRDFIDHMKNTVIDESIGWYWKRRDVFRREYDEKVNKAKSFYADQIARGLKTKSHEKGRLIELKEEYETKQRTKKAEHKERLKYLKSVIVHADELFKSSVDKKNLAFLVVPSLKDYLY